MSKNLSVPIATYLFPSKSTNANSRLATPTIVSVTRDAQPPTFSGKLYLNLTLSQSTQRCSAPAAVFVETTKSEAEPKILDPFLPIVKLLDARFAPESIK